MTSTSNDCPALMTEKQLAERWQMNKRSLYRLRSEGTGPPYIKIGVTILYKLADIKAYEKQNTISN
tara:strand:+ start:3268 stop:3465 length:198 start_codon:yes stop_codon:yes gene_type:complete